MARMLTLLMGLSLMSAISLSASADFSLIRPEYQETGFVEENSEYVPVNAFLQSGITQAQFNNLIDRVVAVYAPIIEAKGKTLEVERRWNDGTVNAYAQQIGNRWIVKMFGGLARHHTINPLGFAMVVCHELGHHIGGAPKKKSWWGKASWASNEGQSDYWGALKCMKRVFGQDDNILAIQGMEVPESAKTACMNSHGHVNDAALCQRITLAGMSLGSLLAELGRQAKPNLDTPSTKVVSKTDDRHPKAQCRLDTYYAGALCNEDPMIDVDDVTNKDPNLGTCNRKAGHEIGMRPLCWFKPTL